MIDEMAKVTDAPLPLGGASARLAYCVRNNKECSDSEFFAPAMKMARKIQNLHFFAGPNDRPRNELLAESIVSTVPNLGKIQILNFSCSPTLLQGRNSESEFSFEAEPSNSAEAPVAYQEYRTSVRTTMRELKM